MIDDSGDSRRGISMVDGEVCNCSKGDLHGQWARTFDYNFNLHWTLIDGVLAKQLRDLFARLTDEQIKELTRKTREYQRKELTRKTREC